MTEEETAKGQAESLYEKLSKPFAPDCVEWVILNARDIKDGSSFWVYAVASPYIQKESAEDRADQVFGPENWENDFSMPDENGRFQYIIRWRESPEDEWKKKKDVGSIDTDGKGNFEDANFEIALAYAEKRVWQKIGIGRYLKLVSPKKVRTQLDFNADWNRYGFKSKFQKDGRGNKKYVKFYWETPSLPDKALPKEYRGKQDFDEPQRPARKKKKKATDEQWEKMEAYLSHAPDEEASPVRGSIYNEMVDDEGSDPTGEVTYERKKISFKGAKKVIDRLTEKYGALGDDGVPLAFRKDGKEEGPEDTPNSKPEETDNEGDQNDMFPEGKPKGDQVAKQVYGDAQ